MKKCESNGMRPGTTVRHNAWSIEVIDSAWSPQEKWQDWREGLGD